MALVFIILTFIFQILFESSCLLTCLSPYNNISVPIYINLFIADLEGLSKAASSCSHPSRSITDDYSRLHNLLCNGIEHLLVNVPNFSDIIQLYNYSRDQKAQIRNQFLTDGSSVFSRIIFN